MLRAVDDEPDESTDTGAEPRRWRAGDVVGGKYRLLRQLGRGGVATVWVAHNVALDVEVALKLIALDENNPRRADRLLQEARAAARLRHAAIVQVNDFGQTREGDPFIVMELLEGETLAEMLRREGALNPVRAVQLLLPIAEALGVAQGEDVVHRDLKPANIVLERRSDGRIQPKVVDFGLARVSTRSSKLTEDGTVMGSPDYMSPEQVAGEHAGHPSDIWAFCVVLYEALAGKVPFRGKNQFSLLKAIMEDEPEPLQAECAELWQLLRRGLHKDPSDRWASIQQLGKELARWLVARDVKVDICSSSIAHVWLSEDDGSDLPPPAPTSAPPRPWLQRWRVQALGAVVLVAATAAVTAMLQHDEPAVAQPPAVSPPATPHAVASGAATVTVTATADDSAPASSAASSAAVDEEPPPAASADEVKPKSDVGKDASERPKKAPKPSPRGTKRWTDKAKDDVGL